MKSKRLIVVSLDALGSTDFEMFSQLPNFKKFIDHAAFCRQVRSVYPSLTYPAHTTIVTGRPPAEHGIVNNILIQPERSSPDWFWQRKYIQGKTLYDEALKKGMRVAALLWPVTAKSDITWNLPEIFANHRWSNQIMTSAANGTLGYQLTLNRKFGSLRDGIRQPALDNFVQASMKYTIRTYRPDMMFVHLTDLDTQRHHFGVHSEEAHAAIERHDRRVGELMHLLHRCGMSVKRDTTVVLLGDHSQLDVQNIILINRFLREQGYIRVQHGKITDWKAYCQNCDGSAYIYIRKNGLEKSEQIRIKNEIYDWLCVMKNDPDNGIAAIYSSKKAKELGADPECTFMLEARRGFYFQNELDMGEIPEVQRATHGFHPGRKDYQTVFMAVGPDIMPGVEIEEMSLMDEGPTMAEIMGLELLGAKGKVLREIFR